MPPSHATGGGAAGLLLREGEDEEPAGEAFARRRFEGRPLTPPSSPELLLPSTAGENASSSSESDRDLATSFLASLFLSRPLLFPSRFVVFFFSDPRLVGLSSIR
jgi:hypothetical protein